MNANKEDFGSDTDPDDATFFGAGRPRDETMDDAIDLTDLTLGLEGEDGEDEAAYLPRLTNKAARYTGFLRLGKGGSGLVRSCRDPNLGRLVAMKTLHPHLGASTFHRTRFIQEARVMAQLEHPGVVPVHELGVNEDEATVYFTMKRIQGATLLQVLKALKEGDGDFTDEFSQARLLDVFIQICQAVAFAHSKGVIHRDLKPDNILLGSFGEVLVVDWGLAKVEGVDASAPAVGANLPGAEPGENTLPGTISGTPLNMAPEQAMGDVAGVDERADVFSLGTLLYHILTLERPFGGKDVPEILHNVIHQDPASPRRRAPDRDVPRELDAICMKALAKKREDRFPTLPVMINELQRFRSGRPVDCCPDSALQRAWKWCRRHPVVSSTVATGLVVLIVSTATAELTAFIHFRGAMGKGDSHKAEGIALLDQQFEALDRLRALQEASPYKLLLPEEIDQRDLLERLIDESSDHFEYAALLYAVATTRDGSPRRLTSMVDIHRRRIAYARHAGQPSEVNRLLGLPRRYLGDEFQRANEKDRAFLLEAERYVSGEGSLKLTSQPPGAEATLIMLRTNEVGVLTRGQEISLGVTPVVTSGVDTASYLIMLASEDRPDVDVVLPLWIEHAEDEVAEVILPREVPEDTVYVPAGPFYAGGEAARSHRLHPVALPGFFIRETEVTFAEYIDYWLAEDGADRSPRDMARVRLDRHDRAFLDAWNEDGELQLDGFEKNLPVVGITQGAAERFCRWQSARTGRTCRLPTAYEWEKAARGVDAREFVWGNIFDSTYALIYETPESNRPSGWFAPPKSFREDRSVYGAYDMGGNVREWTSTPFMPVERGSYEVKGASAVTTRRFLYIAYASDTPVVPTDIGFRYLIEFDPARDMATGDGTP